MTEPESERPTQVPMWEIVCQECGTHYQCSCKCHTRTAPLSAPSARAQLKERVGELIAERCGTNVPHWPQGFELICNLVEEAERLQEALRQIRDDCVQECDDQMCRQIKEVIEKALAAALEKGK